VGHQTVRLQWFMHTIDVPEKDSEDFWVLSFVRPLAQPRKYDGQPRCGEVV
jgi:hypothetical protein